MVQNIISIEIEDIVKRYKEKIMETDSGLKEIIVFGSFAKGTAHKWSDIDVAVITEGCSDDDIKEYVKYRKIARTIDDRIEPHVFKPSAFAPEIDPLAKEVKTYGIII